MTPRVYANPFRRESEAAVVVSKGEPRYAGPIFLRGETLIEWVRDVTYSDGTVLRDTVSSETLHNLVWSQFRR